MTTPNLAKIERLPNLRAIWPNEAQDFTPWLAENLAELGEALGMDLELQQTEAPVGGYSLDILATDLNSNHPVIIENQLEATDHTHLGQLLTYAAGFDAGAIVWVTREFRDEHRQALDWLNQRTGEDTQFFGVAVELWRIADSLPAPHFTLAATPNGWRKQAGGAAVTTPSVPSERSERYRVFFQALVDTLRNDYSFTNVRKARPRSWQSFASGRGGFRYLASFIQNEQVRVALRIEVGDRDQNLAFLDGLKQNQEQVESAIGQEITWQQPLQGNRACRLAISRPGSIDDLETLNEIRDWMVDNLLKVREVFGPRLAELVASDFGDYDEEE